MMPSSIKLPTNSNDFLSFQSHFKSLLVETEKKQFIQDEMISLSADIEGTHEFHVPSFLSLLENTPDPVIARQDISEQHPWVVEMMKRTTYSAKVCLLKTQKACRCYDVKLKNRQQTLRSFFLEIIPQMKAVPLNISELRHLDLHLIYQRMVMTYTTVDGTGLALDLFKKYGKLMVKMHGTRVNYDQLSRELQVIGRQLDSVFNQNLKRSMNLEDSIILNALTTVEKSLWESQIKLTPEDWHRDRIEAILKPLEPIQAKTQNGIETTLTIEQPVQYKAPEIESNQPTNTQVLPASRKKNHEPNVEVETTLKTNVPPQKYPRTPRSNDRSNTTSTSKYQEPRVEPPQKYRTQSRPNMHRENYKRSESREPPQKYPRTPRTQSRPNMHRENWKRNEPRGPPHKYPRTPRAQGRPNMHQENGKQPFQKYPPRSQARPNLNPRIETREPYPRTNQENGKRGDPRIETRDPYPRTPKSNQETGNRSDPREPYPRTPRTETRNEPPQKYPRTPKSNVQTENGNRSTTTSRNGIDQSNGATANGIEAMWKTKQTAISNGIEAMGKTKQPAINEIDQSKAQSSNDIEALWKPTKPAISNVLPGSRNRTKTPYLFKYHDTKGIAPKAKLTTKDPPQAKTANGFEDVFKSKQQQQPVPVERESMSHLTECEMRSINLDDVLELMTDGRKRMDGNADHVDGQSLRAMNCPKECRSCGFQGHIETNCPNFTIPKKSKKMTLQNYKKQSDRRPITHVDVVVL